MSNTYIINTVEMTVHNGLSQHIIKYLQNLIILFHATLSHNYNTMDLNNPQAMQ